MKRLKFVVAAITSGVWGDEPSEKPELQFENLVCVRVADFNMAILNVSERKLTFRRIEEAQQKGRLLEKGDLLLEKSGGGDNQPVGRVVLYDLEHKAVCSNFVARIVPRKSILSRYLLFYFAFLDGARITANSIKQTTGIQNLDTTSYFNLKIPLPPLNEQRAIVAHIESQLATIRDAQTRIEREIELARELYTTLVAEVVTGQIDVSGWEGASQESLWDEASALGERDEENENLETDFEAEDAEERLLERPLA